MDPDSEQMLCAKFCGARELNVPQICPAVRLACYYTELGFEVVALCFPFITKQGSSGKLQFEVFRSSQCSLRLSEGGCRNFFPQECGRRPEGDR